MFLKKWWQKWKPCVLLMWLICRTESFWCLSPLHNHHGWLGVKFPSLWCFYLHHQRHIGNVKLQRRKEQKMQERVHVKVAMMLITYKIKEWYLQLQISFSSADHLLLTCFKHMRNYFWLESEACFGHRSRSGLTVPCSYGHIAAPNSAST